jgi:hypothetical protein
MGNTHRSNTGFALSELLITITTFAVIVLIGFFIIHATHDSKVTTTNVATSASATSKPQANLYAMLSPAAVPSKVPECSQALSYNSDGDSSPIQCADGSLNVLEWSALSALEPSVMSLGYSPTVAQVESALCTDARDSDSDANTDSANAIEMTTYQISALYYGWNFSSNPSVVLTNGTC